MSTQMTPSGYRAYATDATLGKQVGGLDSTLDNDDRGYKACIVMHSKGPIL